MDEDVSASLSISIDDMVLQITNVFTYLDFTITNNLSLNMIMYWQSGNSDGQIKHESIERLSADQAQTKGISGMCP